jgi:uncharacterized membrane protein YdbT with pleckstrin-like domain
MGVKINSFVRKNLLPDETCVATAQFSTFYTVWAFVTLTFWIIAGVGIDYLVTRYGARFLSIPLPLRHLPVYAGSAIGVSLFIAMMLKQWTTEIVLTDQRLIYKRGLFIVRNDEVDIEQLASDNVTQSFLGQIFNYGIVHIRCIEASDIILPPIQNPSAFRNAVDHQKHQYREHYMKVERLRHHGDTGEEINHA